jgi:transcriptional regulator with XRE-family HTH domain
MTPIRTVRRTKKPGDRAGGAWGDGLRARLKSLREERGESGAEFATACNIRVATISEWDNALQLPSLKHLRDIAEKTGVSLDWLVQGDTGSSVRYREQSRTKAELEDDVKAAALTAIRDRRLNYSGWHVDGRALLKEALQKAAADATAWVRWMENVLQPLEGTASAIEETLERLEPYVTDSEDRDLGLALHNLAVFARDLKRRAGKHEMPPRRLVFPRYQFVRLSGPHVGPKEALYAHRSRSKRRKV